MPNAVQLGKAYVFIGAKTDGLSKALGQMQARMQRFGRSMATAAAQFGGLGTAILTPLGLAARTGLEFEKNMAKVKAVTASTTEEFIKMEETARMLGATTSFTASAVADGMQQLGRAGFRANEIISAIPTTLSLARASGLSMGEVAEIMADVSRAFGVSALNIERVADAITYTANNATTSIEGMGEAMKFVSATAVAANQDLETITGALGVLANRGLKGSIAGTSLNTALANLATTKAQDALKRLNVEVEDGYGNMRNLVDIFSDLSARMSNVAPIDRTAFIFELFGKRGARAAQILSTMTDEWRQFIANTERAKGVTRETADTMEGRLNRSLNEALSAFEALQITIKRQLEPTFRSWLATIRDLFNEVSMFIRENGNLVVGLAKVGAVSISLAAAFGTLAIAVKGLTAAYVGAKFALIALEGKMALFNAHALAMHATTINITGAFSKLVKVLKVMASIDIAIFGAQSGKVAITMGSLVSGFKGLGATAIGAGAGIGKAALAFAAAIGPALALAAAIAAVGVAIYKAYQYFANVGPLKATQNETKKLNDELDAQLHAVTELNKQTRTGLWYTQEKAKKDLTDYVKKMAAAGKSTADIRKELKKAQAANIRLTYDSPDADPRFRDRNRGIVNEARKTSKAISDILKDGQIEQIRAQQQADDRRKRLKSSLLDTLKIMEEKYNKDILDAQRQAAQEAERIANKRFTEADPKSAAAGLREIATGINAEIQSQMRMLESLMRVQAVDPREEREEKIKRETDALEQLRDRLRSITDAERDANDEAKRRADDAVAANANRQEALSSAFARINEVFRQNAVTGEKQYDQLSKKGQDYLQKMQSQLTKLMVAFDGGKMSAQEFQDEIAKINQGISDALSSRKAELSANVDVTTRGTFSALAARRNFATKEQDIGKKQLEVLVDIYRVLKRERAATFGG